MAVRNFWIEGQVDGQTKKTIGGPMSKDGGFSLSVKMRDKGEITKPLIIEGRADSDGNLTLMIQGHKEGWEVVADDAFGVVLKKETER